MSLNITVHRGGRAVGGSCLEIASSRTRLVLDLGLPLFDAERQPLDSLQLRRMSTDELAAGGFLTPVAGLFDDGPRPDAILLSHAHLDHTGLLDRTTPDIPVYATVGASKMMLAGDLCARQVAIPRERFRELKSERAVTIGDLTVTPYSVDHSIFDCVALLAEGAGKSVLYTGDLLLHGRKPGMAQRLIGAFQDRSLDVLIQEGTHFNLPDGTRQTEYQLETAIVEEVRRAPGLVLPSFSPQHVDRLIAFIRAAQQTGRTFVPDVYTAFILYLISSQISVPVPCRGNDLPVFFPQHFTKTAKQRGTYRKFEELFGSSRIHIGTITAQPTRHLMGFRSSMLDDFGGDFPAETICIFSQWRGYLNTPQWQNVREFLSRRAAGVDPLPLIHTSGHIISSDIAGFVAALRPKAVLPVHTFCPEEFGRRFANVLTANDGEKITVP